MQRYDQEPANSGSKASGWGSLLWELKNRREFWGKGFCKVYMKWVSSCKRLLAFICLYVLDCLLKSFFRIFVLLRKWDVEHPWLYQLQTLLQMKVFINLLICILNEMPLTSGLWFKDQRVKMVCTTSASLDQFHWFLLKTPDWFQ